MAIAITRNRRGSIVSEHRALIQWRPTRGDFSKGTYSREHLWRFDGGTEVPACASPAVVPVAFGNPANVDPEEAFVAAIASCHMLTFLFLASRQGFVVTSYDDQAVGHLASDNGKQWIERAVLRPAIRYLEGKKPTREEEAGLHDQAHAECFIANSVRTEISVEPVPAGE